MLILTELLDHKLQIHAWLGCKKLHHKNACHKKDQFSRIFS